MGTAHHLRITETTYHRRRNQYGGMKADDAKRLRVMDGTSEEVALADLVDVR